MVVEHEHEPAAQVVDVGPAVGLDGGAEGVGVALHVGDGDELLVVEHRVDLVLDGGEGALGGGDRLHEAEVERVGDDAVLHLEVDHDREVIGVVLRPGLELGEAGHEGEAAWTGSRPPGCGTP